MTAFQCPSAGLWRVVAELCHRVTVRTAAAMAGRFVWTLLHFLLLLRSLRSVLFRQRRYSINSRRRDYDCLVYVATVRESLDMQVLVAFRIGNSGFALAGQSEASRVASMCANDVVGPQGCFLWVLAWLRVHGVERAQETTPLFESLCSIVLDQLPLSLTRVTSIWRCNALLLNVKCTLLHVVTRDTHAASALRSRSWSYPWLSKSPAPLLTPCSCVGPAPNLRV